MSHTQNDVWLETKKEATEENEDYGTEMDEREAERYEDRAEESNYQGL